MVPSTSHYTWFDSIKRTIVEGVFEMMTINKSPAYDGVIDKYSELNW